MHPMDHYHRIIHNSHSLVPPNPFLHHKDNHMLGLILFNPLPFNNIKILNNFIQLIHPISQTILERKEKIKTILISDQEETRTNPNKTNLQGATRTKGTRTPKGEITTNAKGRTTIIFRQTSLVPFVVNMVIILTIAPKLLTLNG
jgi:hypothetical protein